MFSAKDLVGALSNAPNGKVDLGIDVSKDLLQPKIDPNKKVIRYYPGQAPSWEKSNNDANNGINNTKSTNIEQPIDRRLARLNAAVTNVSQDNSSQTQPRRRRIYEAEVVVQGNNTNETSSELLINSNDDLLDIEENEEEVKNIPNKIPIKYHENITNEDDVTSRRARALKKIEEQKTMIENIPKSIHSSSSSSEYETDSDEDSDDENIVIKPIFIPKNKRETIKNENDDDSEAAEEAEILKDEERKFKTRLLVAESIRKIDEKNELELVTDIDSDAGLPDDNDDVTDEELQYEEWKIRELKRLKRDTDERALIEMEKADIIRRRNMTDAERLAEDTKLGKFASKEKGEYKFMQKYYHKGVFYMDETSLNNPADVRLKDYNAPTLEDHYNKAALPSVLQVKNFGKKGRTKYTHLNDQDTTYGTAFKYLDKKSSMNVGGDNSAGTEGFDDEYVDDETRMKQIQFKTHLPLKPDQNVVKSFNQKRSFNGDLDNAGKLKKKKF
jgi:microfibrillar-associated protein 1